MYLERKYRAEYYNFLRMEVWPRLRRLNPVSEVAQVEEKIDFLKWVGVRGIKMGKRQVSFGSEDCSYFDIHKSVRDVREDLLRYIWKHQERFLGEFSDGKVDGQNCGAQLELGLGGSIPVGKPDLRNTTTREDAKWNHLGLFW